MRHPVVAWLRIALLAAAVATSTNVRALGAQHSPAPDSGRGRLALVTTAPAGVARGPATRTEVALPSASSAALASTRRPALAYGSATAGRSRARGARNGLLIGIAVGALAGLMMSDDFYDDRGLNVVVGAASFGLLGALVGTAVGAR